MFELKFIQKYGIDNWRILIALAVSFFVSAIIMSLPVSYRAFPPLLISFASFLRVLMRAGERKALRIIVTIMVFLCALFIPIGSYFFVVSLVVLSALSVLAAKSI